MGYISWDAPDTAFSGYPDNLKAGYRISGRNFLLEFKDFKNMK
jgi:hypothetical protein